MVLEIGTETVIERCIRAFYNSCASIIVVTGKYHEDIKQCVTAHSKVRIVYNRDYRQGMFRSVKAGAAHVMADRFFITPGDYPLLKADTVARMLNTSGCFVAPVYQARQGHPILLDKLLVPGILSSAALSLRDCLRGTPVKGLSVDDIGVITDIDTIEDYQAAVNLAGGASMEQFGGCLSLQVFAPPPAGQNGIIRPLPACSAHRNHDSGNSN